MTAAIDRRSRRGRGWGRAVAAIIVVVSAIGLIVSQTKTAEDSSSPAVSYVINMTPGEATLIKDQILTKTPRLDEPAGNGDVILFKDTLQSDRTEAEQHSTAFAEKDQIESGATRVDR